MNHRVASTAIRQPAGITAVQATELPGSKELAHLGNVGAVFPAGLLCLCQGQLLGVLQVVYLPCGKVGREGWPAEGAAREDGGARRNARPSDLPKQSGQGRAQGATRLWALAMCPLGTYLPSSDPLSEGSIPPARGLGSLQACLYSTSAFPNCTLDGHPT